MTKFLLVRHGQTDWNKEKRIQGQLDVNLSEHGRKQAYLVGQALRDYSFDKLYSSDLSRALDTATIIAGETGVPLTGTCQDLREIHFGDWSGMTFAEIGATAPEALAYWREDTITRAVPGGESFAEMAQRSMACLTDLGRKHPEQTVVVVSHGGPITYLLGTLLKLTLEERLQLKIINCSLSSVIFEPQEETWTVELVNETGHLAEDKTEGVSY